MWKRKQSFSRKEKVWSWDLGGNLGQDAPNCIQCSIRAHPEAQAWSQRTWHLLSSFPCHVAWHWYSLRGYKPPLHRRDFRIPRLRPKGLYQGIRLHHVLVPVGAQFTTPAPGLNSILFLFLPWSLSTSDWKQEGTRLSSFHRTRGI